MLHSVSRVARSVGKRTILPCDNWTYTGYGLNMDSGGENTRERHGRESHHTLT